MHRRALIGAGIGGAALSLLPFLSGRAAATATTTAGTTTTTAPPLRPTDADVALLGFAQQVEITAAALYDQALAKVKWTPEQQVVVATIRQAHVAYAQRISATLGRQAPNTKSADLFTKLSPSFTGDSTAVLTAAWKLESAAVATHLDLLAKLQGINGGALVASILVTEARHCTILADLASLSDLPSLLVDTEESSLLGNG
jgi:hypothetical protein